MSAAPKLDVNFFKPFIEGATNTFKVQCATETVPGKPFFKGKEGGESPSFEITAILGLTSPAFTGTISICYPKAVFLGLMNRMLRENATELSPELEDGAAELLNIIFGHAKRVLNTQGYSISMAIPTIIRGSGLRAKHVANAPTLVLPFKSDLGDIWIEICTHPNMP